MKTILDEIKLPTYFVMCNWNLFKMSTPVSNRKYGAQKIRLTSEYLSLVWVKVGASCDCEFGIFVWIEINNYLYYFCFSIVREKLGPEGFVS